MRNYEYDDQSLANEIAKNLILLKNMHLKEIYSVRERYPTLKNQEKY